MLFNEPKLLKPSGKPRTPSAAHCFSALQRAEIAETSDDGRVGAGNGRRFSALQRAEIAETLVRSEIDNLTRRFSALQRAEIAETLRVLFRQRFRYEFQCSSTSRNC